MSTSEEKSTREQGAQTEIGKIDMCGGWKINARSLIPTEKIKIEQQGTKNKSQILISLTKSEAIFV
jgi:hypothetical protein